MVRPLPPRALASALARAEKNLLAARYHRLYRADAFDSSRSDRPSPAPPRVSSSPRFCTLNNDPKHDTCEAPQEIDDDEIDILLKAQQEAEETGKPMVPGVGAGKSGGGWKSSKRDDDMCKPVGGGKPGVNDNVWHRIHRNIFTHREPKSVTEDDVLICNCVRDPSGAGCGENCINRDVLVECDPAFCPCGAGCANQRFQKKQYAKLDIARTGRKGHGLFTKQPLRKKEFIIEYIGEVLHEDVYRARKQRYEEEGRRHYYFMTLSSSETIDAAERGNAGRFLNHSCEPNCETQKWMVNGELCIGIFALRDVAAGEELTFDYNFERYGDNPIKCYCGSSKCGGWIGAPKTDGEEGGPRLDDDDDYEAEPAPRMLEADEARIEEEETRGREERNRARMASRRGSGEDGWRPSKVKDVYGNDDDDYDGDGEIAAAKKEAAKREREAEREAARRSGGGGGGRKSVGGVRRSGSSASFRRAGSSGGLVSSYAYAPSTAKRRSEVDVRMESLRGQSGAVRNAKAAVHCCQLFNLAYPVLADGTQSVSKRDLGLLLEAVALTTNPATQATLVEHGVLQAFMIAVNRLRGADAEPEHVPILRKIVKIVAKIHENAPSLTVKTMMDTKTPRGTLAQALADLSRSTDAALRGLASDLAARLPRHAVETPYKPVAGGSNAAARSAVGWGAAPRSASPAPSAASARGSTPRGGWGPGPGQGSGQGPGQGSGQGFGPGSTAASSHPASTPQAQRPPNGTPGGFAHGTPTGTPLGAGAGYHRGAPDPGSGFRGGSGATPGFGSGATPGFERTPAPPPRPGGFGSHGDLVGAAAGAPPGSAMRAPPPGSAMGAGPRTPASAMKNARPGDWLCPQGCGVVFASKNRCFRCGCPKPPGSAMGGGAMGGSAGLANGRGAMGGGAMGAAAASSGWSGASVGGGFAGAPSSASATDGGGGWTSAGGKRGWDDRGDRGDDRGGARARMSDVGGGWGGVVKTEAPPPPPLPRGGGGGRGAPPPPPAPSPAPGGGFAPPPGMGVASARAAAPAGTAAPPPPPPPPSSARAKPPPPPQEPLPTRAPTLAERWDSPNTQEFIEAVEAIMAWAMVPYRSESHPAHVRDANYDRLAAKLVNLAVEREQTMWKRAHEPIVTGVLRERLERFCAQEVREMKRRADEGRT